MSLINWTYLCKLITFTIQSLPSFYIVRTNWKLRWKDFCGPRQRCPWHEVKFSPNLGLQKTVSATQELRKS